MTEREKLIELMAQADERCFDTQNCRECVGYGKGGKCGTHLYVDHLLANGVIVPPVEIGQTVWFISPVSYKPKITETVIKKVVWKSGGVYIKLGCNSMYETSCKSIGKTVFLTKLQAEEALNEQKKL